MNSALTILLAVLAFLGTAGLAALAAPDERSPWHAPVQLSLPGVAVTGR